MEELYFRLNSSYCKKVIYRTHLRRLFWNFERVKIDGD